MNTLRTLFIVVLFSFPPAIVGASEDNVPPSKEEVIFLLDQSVPVTLAKECFGKKDEQYKENCKVATENFEEIKGLLGNFGYTFYNEQNAQSGSFQNVTGAVFCEISVLSTTKRIKLECWSAHPLAGSKIWKMVPVTNISSIPQVLSDLYQALREVGEPFRVWAMNLIFLKAVIFVRHRQDTLTCGE